MSNYTPAPSLNENDLAIIERADTASRAYTAGQYVSWHGRTGRVKADILQGATLSDNLFDYNEDGVLNAPIVKWSKRSYITNMSQGSSYTAPQNGYLDIMCIKNDDGAASELVVKINGRNIFRYYAKSSDQVYAPCIIPLSAGDVVVFATMTNMYRINIDMISFIPVE